MDPATRIGSLASAANLANVFGVLRDRVMTPNTLAVVYISGAFIYETLKCDPSTTVDDLVPRLRELGIFARPSVHYPAYPRVTPTALPEARKMARGSESREVTSTESVRLKVNLIIGGELVKTGTVLPKLAWNQEQP
jgi:hypothetical protein